VKADFYTSISRSPMVYRGNPFLIEVGLAYGGEMPGDELVDLWRFANRVPLQYQQSGCAITRGALMTDWRHYGLQQSKGALPTGPMILFVHMASVWVPFTSESKEAVASYPEIIKELRLALQECGRRLGVFLRQRERLAEAEKKKSYIKSYIPHIGIALREILGLSKTEEQKVVAVLTDTLERSRTA
jgi:DNA topoisomerase-6 subunit B